MCVSDNILLLSLEVSSEQWQKKNIPPQAGNVYHVGNLNFDRAIIYHIMFVDFLLFLLSWGYES